jgi:hypothetical protein
MAVCPCCHEEMQRNLSCEEAPLVLMGRAYPPVRWGTEPGFRRIKVTCRDCGTVPGGVHHHGCCMEVCPKCRRQLISCGCMAEYEPKPWVYLGGRRVSRYGPRGPRRQARCRRRPVPPAG